MFQQSCNMPIIHRRVNSGVPVEVHALTQDARDRHGFGVDPVGDNMVDAGKFDEASVASCPKYSMP